MDHFRNLTSKEHQIQERSIDVDEYRASLADKGFFQRLRLRIMNKGRQFDVNVAAPTQHVFGANEEDESVYIQTNSTLSEDGGVKKDQSVEIKTVAAAKPTKPATEKKVSFTYAKYRRRTLAGRLFDLVTEYMGSAIVFLITLAILIAWAVWGIVARAPNQWQIVMQDGSSIQCYISDTLLMRQQQNNYTQLLINVAELRSRLVSLKRMFLKLQHDEGEAIPVDENYTPLVDRADLQDTVGDAVKLPVENVFDVVCNWISRATGSIYSSILYWICIIIWAASGTLIGFNDNWQLYINTAVAVELTFTSVFLQNTRHRHMRYLEHCLSAIIHIDSVLELELRRQSGDRQENPICAIKSMKVSRSCRAIDYYSDVIGSGIGAIICFAVLLVWLIMGKPMNYSDDWWLIIGTYTGLVGFLDGFVLRNVYYRQDTYSDNQIETLIEEDEAMFQTLGFPLPYEKTKIPHAFGYKVSEFVGNVCSSPWAVAASVLIIAALLIIACILHWSTTGQLLCNTPTMIIEGALLIILLEAHNTANTKLRVEFRELYLRRLSLLRRVAGVAQ
ncbi:iron/zinc ion transporter [Schizosaccharomyces japonicus yFS275]|uniref:Iron/zinc ion transporter n=1 Tax=Schizosaccharomyces japonicus (strain yFS275 / FY16936) TaxID=402676 RepID=B6K2Z1_SCHJY|nr:iron/zinc ion transporter [Schizosaccharomyces japonicus yFS275]EEB07848.1 iron/zinc ion transporter [Schizosaccharomyces japonicus yFS275]